MKHNAIVLVLALLGAAGCPVVEDVPEPSAISGEPSGSTTGANAPVAESWEPVTPTTGAEDDDGGDGSTTTGGDDDGADGSSTDGGAVPSSCDATPAVVCDGFEDGAPAPAWTTHVQGASTVTIDDTRAARGDASLRAQGSTATLETTALFPAPGNRVFGRAFYWIPSPAPGPHPVQLVTATGPSGPGNLHWSVGLIEAFAQSQINGPGIEQHLRSAVEVPLETWFCLEWELDADMPQLRVWLDDTEVADAAASEWEGAAWERIRVGFQKLPEETDPPEGFVVWVDEVALGHERIGCDA